MGARPSSFKKSGGFLNGVDGVISGYQFTDEFNGVAFVAGKDPKTKKERFHSLYTVLSVRVDGADEDVTTTLFTGGADDFEVTDDGHTLSPIEEGRELGANTPFAKLVVSLVEAGFPESNLPEDVINFESIIGTRARFEQRVNVEDTKKLGKRKDKKTGKEYERQDLVITQVYELASKIVKAAPKAPVKSAKSVKPAVQDISELAGEALLEIVQAAGGSITKAKLSMKTLTTPLLKGNPNRDAVRKFLCDGDDNLEAIAESGIVTYDKSTGEIEAVA